MSRLLPLLRSIVGVVIGYLAFAVAAFGFFQLTGIPPHAEASIVVMVVSTGVGMIAATVGGFVAAAIAGRHPTYHSTAVAALIALGALVSLIMTVGHGAIWSQVATLIFIAPSAITGGSFRRMMAE